MAAIRTALISAYDKAGLREFATGLVALGVKILSSGGTASHLRVPGAAGNRPTALRADAGRIAEFRKPGE